MLHRSCPPTAGHQGLRLDGEAGQLRSQVRKQLMQGPLDRVETGGLLLGVGAVAGGGQGPGCPAVTSLCPVVAVEDQDGGDITVAAATVM
ncbi:hypothetical protein, partial [Streptomyces erythrochromogenes]|uniref:hypothetical protein n=1 Tax=Streptomyces erythrochromogenes TaxID=285574 RepID=UPI0036D13B1E